MPKIIRIGTRSSELALWQATKVSKKLIDLGHKTELVPIKSKGDIVLDKPLYKLGVTGIFTKNLDIALLNGRIDIAVHSLKDVPVDLPKGIIQVAVIKRANYNDVIVLKGTEGFFAQPNGIIATGSMRRKAMWLSRYPTHKIIDLRGNINSRLKRLENSNWDGAIFAAAGLERIGKKPLGAINLSWMIPAPGQGTIMIACLENNTFVKETCKQLNHPETQICVDVERGFLKALEGGCSSPIGALAYINKKTQELNFKGVLLKKDGTKKITVAKTIKVGSHQFLAKDCADYIINNGGLELMLESEKTFISKHCVFSTKKLSKAQKKILPNSIDIQDSDFIKIRFNRISHRLMLNENENVVISSQNGVEAILNSFAKNEIKFKNIFCVGRRTKKLIESKIGKVAYATKNAKTLAEYISKKSEIKEITYFCSNISLDILPDYLEEKSIKVSRIEVYKTMLSPIKIDNSITGVLFFSPSGIRSYLLKNTIDVVAFCIGETTAKEAKKHFKNIRISDFPDTENLLHLVKNYYQSK